MIKRILGSKLPAVAYNPSGVVDINYFKDLHNAGCLPVFDTEFIDTDTAIKTVDQLAESGIIFGVRLYTDNNVLRDYLHKAEIPTLDLIVLAYNSADELKNISFRLPGSRLFVETIDINITEDLAKIDPDGIILKGSEAPGRVSQYTSFILMQWYLKHSSFPLFIHGGVGLYTTAGLLAAGASGVVLDNQLFLTDEAPLSPAFKEALKKMEEFDSVVVGRTLTRRYRFFCKLATKIVKTLTKKESTLTGENNAGRILYDEIKREITAPDNTEKNPLQSLFYMGQDAVFAKHFVKKSSRLKDVIKNVFETTGEMLKDVDLHDPLKPGSRLAVQMETTYPIVQGPMANISDNADFAAKVNDGGALPFFAMGSLPPALVEDMIKDGNKKVNRFGAGLIGIEALNKTVTAHIELVKKYKVPYALFAGGIPSQVRDLEDAGTRTWLHTPAMGMLDNAISSGCSGFIFEGTEAGGHVGRLSSLVLWELAVDRLLTIEKERLDQLTLIFAGGIGTEAASLFISGMTSTLYKHGASVGIQLGTPYLFTKEIVETKALKQKYQDVITAENETYRIGTTVGLPCRTIKTPFAQQIIENEHTRIAEGVSLNDRKTGFEKENIGSLLVAAKGFVPDFEAIKKEGKLKYINYSDSECFQKGNYSTGDALSFYNDATTITALHDEHTGHGKKLTANLNALEIFSTKEQEINDEIAIIGMGCVYPDADNTDAFWENIISKKYSIKEVDEERFAKSLYYNADRKAKDKCYSKIAGVVTDFTFDSKKFGLDEKLGSQISRSQQMLLEATFQAVESAGYLNGKEIPAASTSVIVGSCLGNEATNNLNLKYFYPQLQYYLDQIDDFTALSDEEKTLIYNELKEKLSYGYKNEAPDCATLNIEASRVASWLGAEGANYVVDAACATSFAALDCGIKELLSGHHDMVITGGVNTSLAPETFVGFSKMGALSADGSYPFDERSNGFVLGEGVGMLVLKRMKDALRDGDPIAGVIKAIGSSSDGKGKAIAAPSSDGQAYAVKRCFDKMDGITPDDIDFIEAHGTSTILGDATELETLKKVYDGLSPIGISSIKSQIGHLLGGAGAAGLIKTLLAIKHKTLPPNGEFKNSPDKYEMDKSTLYIIGESKEWKTEGNKPRRAAISSYGFGGINYHGIFEEYNDAYKAVDRKIFTDTDYNFNDDRIVICGIGTILPGAQNKTEFWEKMVSGKKDFTTIPDTRLNNSYYANTEDEEFRLPMVQAGLIEDYKFNNLKYRIPPKTAGSLDKAQFYALDATSQALEDAFQGESPAELFEKGNKTAVILGSISGERNVETIVRTRIPFIEKTIMETAGLSGDVKNAITQKLGDALRDRYLENNEDTTPGLLSNIISGRVANYFGCNGANFVVDAACASGGIAMDMAVKGLKNGDHDVVITGGVDANFYPAIMMVFKKLGMLTEGQGRIFDKRGQGVNLSEGAVLMIMTTLKKAREKKLPVMAEISGFAYRSKPSRNLYAPSEALYRHTTNICYNHSDVSPNQVSHVDVFGFSNLMLDQIEHQASAGSFETGISFGNIKSEFGYYKGANPALGIARLAMMAKKRTLLPNWSYSKEHSIVGENSALYANPEMKDLAGNGRLHFATNLFGFGANHGHGIVSTLPAWLDSEAKAIPVTATKTVRPAVAAKAAAPKSGMAALLCGQGSQYPGMMKELYQKNGEVQRVMDRAEEIFRAERGGSLLEMMFGDDDRLNSTENTQPAVFTATAAIYEVLKSRGFQPDRFIGHSVGEYSALYCSGMLDFEPAMNLVLTRSRLMKEADQKTPGRILVVFGDAEKTAGLIEKSGISDIYVTNKNSSKQTGVSGLSKNTDDFSAFLSGEGIMFRKLQLTGAFHTPILKEAAEKLQNYMKNVRFNPVDFSRVISNVTGAPYPADEKQVKELLITQIISPVEFIKSVKQVTESGITDFIEVGTGSILTGMLKYMDLGDYTSTPSVDKKAGENTSLETLIAEKLSAAPAQTVTKTTPIQGAKTDTTGDTKINTANYTEATSFDISDSDDFEDFITKNQSSLKEVLFKEYEKSKKEKRLKELDQFGFFTGSVAISGVSIGLPGTAGNVFNQDNFHRLLSGHNFIENLTPDEQNNLLDKNITKVQKSPDGNARMVTITNVDEVIHLAGKLGYFNLEEYGVDYKYDVAIGLAMAAGIEALKDANIPLVQKYIQTSSGRQIPDGFALPESMQARTGVIMTSLFQGWESLIGEINAYYQNKFYVQPYEELEKIYYHLMEKVTDREIKDQITDWFFKMREKRKQSDTYQFDRDLVINAAPLGSAHFAQMIRAKGPNIQLCGACASTTQACGVAEDWIRAGRCDRVIIVGGEAATNEHQGPWIASSFLSMGAATIEKRVQDAAKPFDEKRNGTILGSGAVSIIIERQDRIKHRGLTGQAEILGTYIGNSAFHHTRIDQAHLASEMKGFVNQVETRHGLNRNEYAAKTIFMSHETYTPARGGSADAEIMALREAFGENCKDITITNTKGFTGHTLGAAIEDAVLVKALAQNKVAPIANLKNIPEGFKDLKFSSTGNETFEYGLHFAAGFGSHFSFLFIKKLNEKSTAGNPDYNKWLKEISGQENPALEEINNTLCITPSAQPARKAAPAAKAAPSAAPVVKAAPVKTGPSAESTGKVIKGIIAEQTGYSDDMLEDDLDLEADLGIDTVKQVEIFGKISAHFGLNVPEDLKLRDLNTIERLTGYIADQTGATAVETTTAAPASGAVAEAVKTIVSEQTGYTADMLEDELDLEADLGIDTVKQVEIFGKISAHFGLNVPEDLKLRDLNTIAKLTEYIAAQTGTAAAAPEAAPAAEAPAASGSGHVAEAVKEIISEQTGYTADMLEDDLDLEADLGIDTVKQVEIFGKISAHFGLTVPEDLKLRDLNSISKLTEYVAAQTGTATTETAQATAPAKEQEAMPETVQSGVKRYSISTKELAATEPKENIFKDKLFLITTDSQGFTDRLLKTIRKNGGSAITLGQRKGDDYSIALNNLDEVARTAKTIAEKHDINGLIHLSPLNSFFAAKETDEVKESEASIKGCFLLIKELQEKLSREGSLISTLSFDSVVFPYGTEKPKKMHPVFAGLSGMFKTINKEFAGATVRVVDFQAKAPKKNAASIIEQYTSELMNGRTRVETGIKGGKRYGLSMIPTPAPKGTKSLVAPGSTVLITGGARGITYEILKELTDTYAPKLVIMGRSDIDAIDDAFKREGVTEAGIISSLKVTMKGKKPLEIKKAAGRIMRMKETLENIAELKKRGVEVTYHAADVADTKAVSAIIEGYDKIDGIVHAAGVEESSMIEKKEMPSFNRVFDTKIKGAANLLSAMKGRKPKFFITFSSVTARFGNESQIDYTCANDMLGRMIQRIGFEHPETTCRVMDWTAWSEAGMATNETVKTVLEARGLTFLPLNQGVGFFMNELFGDETVEAVFTGADHNFDRDNMLEDDNQVVAPFIDAVTSVSDEKATFSRILDLKRDLFLKDHSMKDIPVFLGATGIETMAEAACELLNKKDQRLASVTNFSIPYGIKILKERPKALEIEASKSADSDGSTLNCRITSRFQKGKIKGKETLHYKGSFHFSDKKSKDVKVSIPAFTPIKAEESLDSLIYHPERLFMDGSFRTIQDILSFDGNTLITKVVHNGDRDFFKGETRPEFLTDVIMIDAMFQTGGLFEFMTSSELVLPYEIEKFDFYKPLERGKEYLCITRKTASEEKTNCYQLQLVDTEGTLFMETSNFRMVKLAKLEEPYKINRKINTAA